MKHKNSKQFQGNGDYQFAFKILVDVLVLQWARKAVFECTWCVSKVSISKVILYLFPFFSKFSKFMLKNTPLYSLARVLLLWIEMEQWIEAGL